MTKSDSPKLVTLPDRPSSANTKPLGRMQRRLISELAKTHTEDAIQTLADIMRNGDSDSSRIAAATALLDRGWGKPSQGHVHARVSTEDGSKVRELSDRELEEIAAGGIITIEHDAEISR